MRAPRLRSRFFVAATFCGLAAANAQDWVGDTSQDWNDPLNWSGDTYPAGANAFVNTDAAGVFPIISADTTQVVDTFVSNGGSAGRVDHRAGIHSSGTTNCSFIGTGSSTGTYNLADTSTPGGGISGFGTGSGTFNAGSRLYVGSGTGTGIVNINTTGALNVNNGAGGDGIFVGDAAGSNGTVNLEAGTVNAIDSRVGLNGTGTLNQTGGTWNDAGWTFIGEGAGAGHINLSGGQFNTGRMIAGIGSNAGNLLTVTGGADVNVNGEAWVGEGAGNFGRMDIDSGTFTTTSWIAVGRNGATGELNLSGTGLVEKTADPASHVVVGSLGGTGTVNQTGGTLDTVGNGEVRLGENGGATGIYNLSGGLVNVDGFLVGWTGGAAGELNISGSGELNTGNLVIAAEADTSGTVSQSGGIANIGGTLDLRALGASGSYSISGGDLNVGGDLAGEGGGLEVSGSASTIDIGGNFTLDGSSDTDFILDASGVSAINVVGDATLAGPLGIDISALATGIGDIELIDVGGALSGPFTTFGEGDLVGLTGDGLTQYFFTQGLQGSFQDGNDVGLYAVPIPEPSVTALFGLVAAGLLYRRRR